MRNDIKHRSAAMHIYKTDVRPSPNGKNHKENKKKKKKANTKKKMKEFHATPTVDDGDYILVNEKKNNIPAGWTEVEPNNNSINYMRRDLCKLIIANESIEYSISK